MDRLTDFAAAFLLGILAGKPFWRWSRNRRNGRRRTELLILRCHRCGTPVRPATRHELTAISRDLLNLSVYCLPPRVCGKPQPLPG